MATGRYWRAALLGAYETGPWAGEIAQVGISGFAADAGGVFVPSIREGLPSFTASESGETGMSSVGPVEYGALGPGVWNKANQDRIAEQMVNFGTAIRPYQSTKFRWLEVRVAALQINDDYIGGATIYTLSSPIQGQVVHEPDVTKAAVISFRSPSRSPRARGRMYVPSVEVNSQVDPAFIPAAARLDLATSGAALVRDLKLVAGQLEAAVVSRVEHTFSTITDVRVGDQFDRMQSRRRRVREIYTKQNV